MVGVTMQHVHGDPFNASAIPAVEFRMVSLNRLWASARESPSAGMPVLNPLNLRRAIFPYDFVILE